MTNIDINNEDEFKEDLEPVESESDLEELLLTELSSAIVQATDWTTETILGQLEKGKIQLNPIFQRRDAWTTERKSKFIESLFLGFPIPQLVLAELRDQRGKYGGKYVVIDGKQRLLSIIQFAGSQKLKENFGSYKLRGLEILTQFNGKSLNELITEGLMVGGLEDFENRTIRTVVIRHWKHDAILYHIFLRLNTESVKLSPQELRNALHPGPFSEFLDLYSGESPALRKILKRDLPDFRMRDAELLLRYYSFRIFLREYQGSMKEFLDLATEELNKLWQTEENEIRIQAKQFEIAVNLSFIVFGNDSFRKWKDGKFVGRFNRAVYDVIMFHFWKPHLEDIIKENAKEIKDAFINLCDSDKDFVEATETTTKSLTATVKRLSSWTFTLNNVLGADLEEPQLINNRIRF